MKSEKICGAKKVETRQRSVGLVLDDWVTRPAYLMYWPIRSSAANRHNPLGATLVATHLWNVHSLNSVKQEVREADESEDAIPGSIVI